MPKVSVRPSRQAMDLVIAAAMGLGAGNATKIGTGTMTATGAYMDWGVIEFVAAQIDVTAELISQGATITPKTLGLVLASKALSFTDLAPNQQAQCAGALASLPLTIGLTVVATPTGVGALVAGAAFVADVYAMYKDCSPLVYDAIGSSKAAGGPK